MDKERARKLEQTFRLMGIQPTPRPFAGAEHGEVVASTPAGIYYNLSTEDDRVQIITIGDVVRIDATRFAVGAEFIPGYRVEENAPLPPNPDVSAKRRRLIEGRCFRAIILAPAGGDPLAAAFHKEKVMNQSPRYYLLMAERLEQEAKTLEDDARGRAEDMRAKARSLREQARALAPAGSPPPPGLPVSKK